MAKAPIPAPVLNKVEKVPENEHIFPATRLTELATRWKELNSAGRHDEAAPVLEQIIVESTPMFERLAQYENFHRTVDLTVLSAAAQEKVVNWLIHWKPKKGSLFSWFCLHQDTPILLANGHKKTIGEIVTKQERVVVANWNMDNNSHHVDHVIGWSKTPSKRKEWRKLSVKRPSGYGQIMYVTGDHPVLTQRGFVEVDSLLKSDSLLSAEPTLTAAGIGALIGLYLGDGSVAPSGYFSVGHGKPQKFYNEFLAEKFCASFSEVKTDKIYFNKFIGKSYNHKGCTRVNIPVRDLWPSAATEFAWGAKKAVTPAILELMTDRSLAYWFMDDGSYSPKSGVISLAACGFTQDECNLLSDHLLFKFNVKTVYSPVVKKGETKPYGILRVPAESRARFFDLVSPYMLNEFSYKLPETHHAGSDSVPFVAQKYAVIGSDRYTVKKRFKLAKSAYTPTPESFNWKYDIQIAEYHNFFAGKLPICVHNSKCCKNSCRSEVGKVLQFRKRHHVTGDNLEKFYGFEEHEVDKHDAGLTVRKNLAKITSRWGSAEELGALHYLIECCIMEGHDKQAAIKGCSYAYGLSLESSKFFYQWSLVALRDAMYEQAYVPFTEQDLVRLKFSYTHLPDLLDILSWDQLKRLIVTRGGMRFKIPTVAQIVQLKEDYATYREIDATAKDPESVAMVAKKRKRTPRTAQEAYETMVTMLNPERSGEFSVYED